MAQIKAKLIEYAYPTSTTATKAGYGKAGCWFVRLYPSIEACITNEKPLVFSADKAEMESYAALLPNPYNWMHKYHNK